MNYGKAKVEIAGREAAPYEVFIGNTHPESTEDKISVVLVKYSEQFSGEEKLETPLQILKVTCLSKPNPSGEPLRTKWWKIKVANKFREQMLKDEAYPYGWSHRMFFPNKTEHTVPGVDTAPKRQHLQAEAAAVSVPAATTA